jgi:putative transposase
MSRFRKLLLTIWHSQYYIIWTPKYRYRIITGDIVQDIDNCVRGFSERLGCEIIETNVQADHVHLLAMVSPKVSISDYLVTIKGRTAIRIFNKYKDLRQKPYWGNPFWSRGYCMDTVGLDAETIQKYVKHPQAKEQRLDKQRQLSLQLRGNSTLAPSGGRAEYPLIGVSKAGPSGVGFLLFARSRDRNLLN